MALPGQTTTVRDGGITRVSPSASVPLVVGVSSSGTANTVQTYTSGSKLRAELGVGPLVEAGVTAIAYGGICRVLRLTSSAATSAMSSVTHTGTGLATVVDNSSVPLEWYELQIVVVVGGALGVATYKYSLDGGRSFGPVLTTAASVTVPNSGIALTFDDAAGDFVAGDIYAFDTQSPTYTATEMDTAFAAIKAYPLDWDFGVLAGRHETATLADGIFQALTADIANLNEPYKYQPWMMDAGGDNEATTLANFTSEYKWIAKCYGTASGAANAPAPGYNTPKRPLYLVALAKALAEKISTTFYRLEGGALPNVPISSFSTEFGSPISHDEFQSPGLGTKGFLTARSWPDGRYRLTEGVMAVSEGTSDFNAWPAARVFAVANKVIWNAQQAMIGRAWTVNADGTLTEGEATAAEKRVEDAMRAVLHQRNADGGPAHISKTPTDPGLFYRLDRTNNVLSTSEILPTWGIRPLGYSKYITTEGGFSVETVA